MAHSFEQRTSNGLINNRNGYDHKYDAPLIGDLSATNTNNNNTNGMNNPMNYPNDEHVGDTLNTMNNQFYGYVYFLCNNTSKSIKDTHITLHFKVFHSLCFLKKFKSR